MRVRVGGGVQRRGANVSSVSTGFARSVKDRPGYSRGSGDTTLMSTTTVEGEQMYGSKGRVRVEDVSDNDEDGKLQGG